MEILMGVDPTITSSPSVAWETEASWAVLGTVGYLLIRSGTGWPSPGLSGGQDCDDAQYGKAPIGTRLTGSAAASTSPGQQPTDQAQGTHKGQSVFGSR